MAICPVFREGDGGPVYRRKSPVRAQERLNARTPTGILTWETWEMKLALAFSVMRRTVINGCTAKNKQNLLSVDKNNIEQCFAAHVVQCCH